jgi:hypothetical protein
MRRAWTLCEAVIAKIVLFNGQGSAVSPGCDFHSEINT